MQSYHTKIEYATKKRAFQDEMPLIYSN